MYCTFESLNCMSIVLMMHKCIFVDSLVKSRFFYYFVLYCGFARRRRWVNSTHVGGAKNIDIISLP